MQISNHLSPAAASFTQTTPAKTAQQSGQTDFEHMTVSQIRDMTDQMASEGRLDPLQQISLANAGLMDGQTSNSGTDTTGPVFTRDDPGTYNLVDMMDGSATLSAYMGDNQLANLFNGIANAVQKYEATEGAAPTTSVKV